MSVALTKQNPSDADRQLGLLDELERRYGRDFLAMIALVIGNLDLDDLEELVRTGRVDQVITEIEKQFLNFSNELAAGIVLAGQSTANFISESLNLNFNFDMTNESAVESMRNARLRTIINLSETQRAAIRQVFIAGITEGLNPREQARAILGAIGLTERQVQSVQNYRRLLEQNSARVLALELRDRRFDSTVQSAISSDKPLTQSQINKMVERYRERTLKFRSQVIARTEALRAVNEGNFLAYQQAAEQGIIDLDVLMREWFTAQDERVRGSHKSMHGQMRGFDEKFVSGQGNLLRFPGDIEAPGNETIQCRCVAITRFL